MKNHESEGAPSWQHSEKICGVVIKLKVLRFFFVLVVCSGLALQTGCNVRVRGRQRPLLVHGPIKGELELVAEKRTDEEGTSQNRRKSEMTVFEERLRFKTEGDIYHPDFLSFNAALGFGLTRQDLSSDIESDKTSDSLNDYSLFAQLLRAKSYPMTFHLNKSEDLIPRQFLGSLRTESESAGFSLALRSKVWPMRFQYNTSETRQNALAPTARDFFTRDDERFRYSVEHDFSELSHMSFEFEREEVSQRTTGASTDIKTNRYTFLHDLIFGRDEQHRLDSFLSFLDQSGSFTFQNLQWEERLRLQHSEDFLTNYELRYTDSEQETFRNKEIRGRAGFEHRLYESLVTTGDIFASKTDLDEGELTQRGGTLGFNYRKKNPWGTLFATYAASFTRTEQSGGEGTDRVTNELHTVPAGPFPVVELDRTNVDTSTIIVKDISGLPFTRGGDYRVVPVNGKVRLEIILNHGVPPDFTTAGQRFFVDYTFFVEPKRQEDTLRQNFTLRERFDNGLSLYYVHQRQDEDVSSNITGITPDEFRINTYGAEYVKKGLSLLAEYSEEESTQIPSTIKRLEARYSWSIGGDTRASVRASNHWLDFDEPDERDVTVFRAGGEIFSRLTDKYTISAQIDYRDEDDTRFGKTEGFQLNSELQYSYRQLSVAIGIEVNSLERRDDEISGDFVYIRVRRSF